MTESPGQQPVDTTEPDLTPDLDFDDGLDLGDYQGPPEPEEGQDPPGLVLRPDLDEPEEEAPDGGE